MAKFTKGQSVKFTRGKEVWSESVKIEAVKKFLLPDKTTNAFYVIKHAKGWYPQQTLCDEFKILTTEKYLYAVEDELSVI